MRERVQGIVVDVIHQFNQQYAGRYELKPSLDTVLFGLNGVLDSLGLVSFIVAVEMKIEQEFHRPTVLADARAISQQNSPFRTVETLIDYIVNVIGEEDE